MAKRRLRKIWPQRKKLSRLSRVCTKVERTNLKTNIRQCGNTWGGCTRGEKKSAQGTSWAEHLIQCLFDTVSRQTENKSKESCRSTVNVCAQEETREVHEEALNTSTRNRKENIDTVTKCFQERFMGQMESTSSWILRSLLAETGCKAKDKIQESRGHCANISGVEVVCVWHYFASGKRRRT